MEYLAMYRKGAKLTQLASWLVCVLVSQLSAARMPERFHSGRHGERITNLRITGMKLTPKRITQPYMPQIIYSVKVPGPLKKGTILSIKAYGELSNRNNYNVMLAWYTVISTNSATDITGFDEITAGMGYNITRAMHHGTFNDADDYEVLTDIQQTDIFINVVVVAASSGAPFSGAAKLTVEQDSGRLSVLVFRPEEPQLVVEVEK